MTVRGAQEFDVLKRCQASPLVVRLVRGRELLAEGLVDLAFPEPRFLLVMPRIKQVAWRGPHSVEPLVS